LDLMVIINVIAFGVFLSFSSYLTYRRRTKYVKKIRANQAVLL
jgi:hypothetical protein